MNTPIKSAIVGVNGSSGERDRLTRFIHGQVERIRPIRNLPSDDDAAAGPLIGIHAGIEEARATRIYEGRCSAAQQFGDAQQRGVAFLLLRHGFLEGEHIGQVVTGTQVVGKDAACGVGV